MLRGLLLALVSFLGEAAVPGFPHSQLVVRDSAGVRLLTYEVATRPALRLGDRPRLSIEASDPCVFYGIRDLVLRPDGGMAVANAGNREVCFFDAAGRFVRRVGREGSGPGEYQGLASMQSFRDDSIVVFDGLLRRVSILAPDGSFARSFLISSPDSLGSVTLSIAHPDGTILLGFSEFIAGAPRPEPVSITERLFRYDPAGRLVGPAGRFPFRELFIQAISPERGGVAYWDRAFGRQMTVVPIAGGFLAGDGSTFSIAQYRGTGELAAYHRVVAPRQPLSSGDVAAYRRVSLVHRFRSSMTYCHAAAFMGLTPGAGLDRGALLRAPAPSLRLTLPGEALPMQAPGPKLEGEDGHPP